MAGSEPMDNALLLAAPSHFSVTVAPRNPQFPLGFDFGLENSIDIKLTRRASLLRAIAAVTYKIPDSRS